jgi:hypothetical protein
LRSKPDCSALHIIWKNGPVKAILLNIVLAHLISHRISGLGWGDLPWHFSTKSRGKTQT